MRMIFKILTIIVMIFVTNCTYSQNTLGGKINIPILTEDSSGAIMQTVHLEQMNKDILLGKKYKSMYDNLAKKNSVLISKNKNLQNQINNLETQNLYKDSIILNKDSIITEQENIIENEKNIGSLERKKTEEVNNLLKETKKQLRNKKIQNAFLTGLIGVLGTSLVITNLPK